MESKLQHGGFGRLAILIAALVLVAGCGPSASPSSPTPASTTSAAATSASATPSPAGSSAASESPLDLASLSGRIAFSAGAPHAEDVYVVNADGTGLHQVTTDPGAEFDPSWSPDGTRLAYRHQPGNDSTTEIFVAGADGSKPTDVSNNEGQADWGPAWSPDGSAIAWNTQRPDMPTGFVLGLVAPDGSHLRTVKPGVWVEYAAWSPDGNRIAFMSQTPTGTENYEIFVMDADGSDVVRLTDSPGPDGWPTWSADGERIAFASVRDDCRQSDAPDCLSTGDLGPFHTLWVMNADGSDQHRLSRHYVQIPDWSPDGRFIVFQTRTGLGILSADGSAYAEISLGLGEPNFPDWLQ